jgi:hypothetical protein
LMWHFSSLQWIEGATRYVCGGAKCPVTRPEGMRQYSRARRMRACRRRGRRRLQRQRWHGCRCRYGVVSRGGKVSVGSVRGDCAPAAAVVTNHGTFAASTAGDGAEAGQVCAGALTTNGAVKITSAAPDAARTLAGSGLADRSDDSPARAPNHAAGGGGTRAGGRGLGGPHAISGTSATLGVGAAARTRGRAHEAVAIAASASCLLGWPRPRRAGRCPASRRAARSS